MIYAVFVLDRQFVKIGFSANDDVGKRISELQTGCPFRITPLFTVGGTLMQEKALHASLQVSFGRLRIPMPPNEWYPGRNPFFGGFLKELRLYGANVALAYSELHDPAVTGKAIHSPKNERKPHRGEHSFEPNLKWPVRADPKALRAEFAPREQ